MSSHEINWAPWTWRNILAASISLIIPGAGQLWQGRYLPAAFGFLGALILWIWGLGWISHLWACSEAARYEGIQIYPGNSSPPTDEPPPSEEPIAPTESPDSIYGRILGLKGPVSFSDVRHAYRERIAQYHPDKVAHLGEAFRMLAEEETKRLNEAWAFFKQKYGNS